MQLPGDVKKFSGSTSKSSPNSSVYTVKQSESTGKTSVESKTSSSKDRSSEKKTKWKAQQHTHLTAPETANGNLDTIAENHDEQQIVPTVVTAERAAAARIFLEIYYNEALSKPSQRELRLRLLKSELWHLGELVSASEKDALKRQFYQTETDHLRQTRVMKARTVKALKEGNKTASSCMNDYQPIKALGKGSFGVVKLVREKAKPGQDLSARQVYAMKVIRKSGMLRTSQEGHLMAERDFLVASEGSRWYVEPLTLAGAGTDVCRIGLSLSLQAFKMRRICIWSWTICQAVTFWVF